MGVRRDLEPEQKEIQRSPPGISTSSTGLEACWGRVCCAQVPMWPVSDVLVSDSISGRFPICRQVSDLFLSLVIPLWGFLEQGF